MSDNNNYIHKEIENVSNNLTKSIESIEKSFDKDLKRVEKTQEKNIEQVHDEIITKINFEFKTLQKNIDSVDEMALKNHNQQENAISRINDDIHDIRDKFEQNIEELKECLTNVKNNKVWLTTLDKIVDEINKKIDKIDRQNEVLRVDSENQNIYDRKIKSLEDNQGKINNDLSDLKGITSDNKLKNFVNYLDRNKGFIAGGLVYVTLSIFALYHAVIDSRENKAWIENVKNKIHLENQIKAKKYDNLIKNKDINNNEIDKLKQNLKDANLLISDYEQQSKLNNYEANIEENTRYFIESEK